MPTTTSTSPSSALVTGAASGIGRATAELLWQRGFSLVLFDLSAPALAELEASLQSRPHHHQQQRCVSVVGDVRDDVAQMRAVETASSLGGVFTVAVVNAGVGSNADFLTSPPLENGDTRRVVDIDLTAALTGVKLSAQAMLKARGGADEQRNQHQQQQPFSIVCVASAAGYFPTPAGPVYAAAKAGLMHACRSLHPRLAARGIRLTAVCPQYIDTPLVDALVASSAARAMMGPLYGRPLLTPGQAAEVICGAPLEPLSAEEVEAGKKVVGELVSGGAAAAGGGGGGSESGSSVGSGVLLLLQDGRVVDPFRRRRNPPPPTPTTTTTPTTPTPSASAVPLLRFPPSACRAFAAASLHHLANQTYQKLVVRELSTDFRRAVQPDTLPLAPLLQSLKPGDVLIRRVFAGVNASDVNWSSGRYHGSTKKARAALPYDAGFESVGVVVAVGAGNGGKSGASSSPSSPFTPGDAVATMESGFSEWAAVPARRCLRVPSPTPEAVALLTSGMTASIALERSAGVKLPARFGFPGPDAGLGPSVASSSASSSSSKPSPPPRVAIVTAAAGGTGQFAVQLLRAAGGWKVVATCSGGPDGPKARLLRRLGADAVVDYRAAAADAGNGGLRGALRRACAEVRGGGGTGGTAPAGADLIYESVGGATFDACVDVLGDRGVLVVIGMMESYGSGWDPRSIKGLPEKLLWKSAAISGFFLLRHAALWAPHLRALGAMAAAGELEVAVDGSNGDGPSFVGIESVADAVDRLQGGKSSGKVVVQLSRELPAGGGGERARL